MTLGAILFSQDIQYNALQGLVSPAWQPAEFEVSHDNASEKNCLSHEGTREETAQQRNNKHARDDQATAVQLGSTLHARLSRHTQLGQRPARREQSSSPGEPIYTWGAKATSVPLYSGAQPGWKAVPSSRHALSMFCARDVEMISIAHQLQCTPC